MPSVATSRALAEEPPPPRGLLVAIGSIAMLPETVPGLTDQRCHVQFEKERRRVERRTLPWRGSSARSTCHSPHKHALAIDV
jgi:hypothetical protein